LGGPLVHLDVTSSTNDRARELALAGAPAGTTVIAEEQTAGRGRQGRSWVTPRGRGLTLSVLIRPSEPESRAARLAPLASALAVCEAAEALAPIECRIKWPNDVLVGDRKLAGILVEARPGDGWVVVGIGLNVDTPEGELPPDLVGRATSLRIESGRSLARDEVLDALLERLAGRLGQSEGEALLADYRARDALAGKAITWTAAGTAFSGEARGIDDRGRLVVVDNGGEQQVLGAGEVHLLR
jgi:BirA family biotin operon repressor/biotin-[acetyl-CoA-carboxylase] ligase